MISSADRLVVEFDERKIDALFAKVDQCHLPGVAGGIALGGKPVYRKGFGLANMELPILLTPSMRMRIGSISKHFTALAYLLLCEEGRATIDDPIRMHLPELHSSAHPITVRQLMGNISGLRDVHDINWSFSGRGHPVTSEQLMSLYRGINDANAAPGSTWIYCNGGFLLLSIAIERIAGKTLEEVLRERIFSPVGMHDSLLRRWDTDFVSNSATLHMTTADGAFDRSYMGTALAGEGGIVSTVDDMLRWLAHMDQPSVGNAATWSLMKAAQRLSNGSSTGYGCGLIVGRHRGFETVQHSGGVMGGNAHMVKVPAVGLDIAIMSNRADVIGLLLGNEILDVCLSGATEQKKTGQDRRVEGVFRSAATGRVIQLLSGSGKQIASVDGTDMPVEWDEMGALRPAGIASHYQRSLVLLGNHERPSGLRFTHFGSTDELERVPPALTGEITSIEGVYRADAIAIDARISNTPNGLRMFAAGPFGSMDYRLECLSAGIWRARSIKPTARDAIISFDREGGGLRFSNDRTWNLELRRAV